MSTFDEQQFRAGIWPKVGVKFTLHVHLDDGTTKDIECVGQVLPPTQQELSNDDLNP